MSAFLKAPVESLGSPRICRFPVSRRKWVKTSVVAGCHHPPSPIQPPTHTDRKFLSLPKFLISKCARGHFKSTTIFSVCSKKVNFKWAALHKIGRVVFHIWDIYTISIYICVCVCGGRTFQRGREWLKGAESSLSAHHWVKSCLFNLSMKCWINKVTRISRAGIADSFKDWKDKEVLDQRESHCPRVHLSACPLVLLSSDYTFVRFCPFVHLITGGQPVLLSTCPFVRFSVHLSFCPFDHRRTAYPSVLLSLEI